MLPNWVLTSLQVPSGGTWQQDMVTGLLEMGWKLWRKGNSVLLVFTASPEALQNFIPQEVKMWLRNERKQEYVCCPGL